MPAATADDPGRRPLERPAQVLLVAVLLMLAAVSWSVTDDRMEGMSAAPGADLGSLGLYLTVWIMMMAAMMLPSLAPMVLAHARIATHLRGRRPGATAAFLTGYLLSWTLYGIVAYVLWNVGREWLLAGTGWDSGGRWLAGGTVAAAGAYQLAPLKDACLSRCRSPFAFLTEEWRDGVRGALTMGTLHGLWCVGCCWAMMAALFALGVMSVGWMAFIAVLVAAEKLLPGRRAATVGIAALLVCIGAGVAVAPEAVPGFVEPTSDAARMP